MGSFRRFTRQNNMNGFALFAVFFVAAVGAAPLEDTPEVAAAKADFKAAFELAVEGKLGELAPVNTDVQAEQIPEAYIADTDDVAAAKAEFMAAFEDAELAAKEAPVAVEEPAAAPVLQYSFVLPYASAYPYTVPVVQHVGVYSLPYVFPLSFAPVQNTVADEDAQTAESGAAVEAV